MTEPSTSTLQRPVGKWHFVEQPKKLDSGFSVHLAATPMDFDEVEAVWNSVYGKELNWLKPAAGPRYEDGYHDHSTYLLAKVAGQAVGTMRLVGDSSRGLPIEQFVSISDLRGDRSLIECQRLMVLSEFRNRRWPEFPFGVLGALVKACLHWSILNGVSHILADVFINTKTTPLAVLKALGFEDTGIEFIDTELAEPDRSLALLLQVRDLFSRSFRTTAPFYRYLMSYDDHIDVYG